MKFEELSRNVTTIWAPPRRIYEESTEAHQKAKGLGEISELLLSTDIENTKSEIGDITVCAINAAHLAGKQIVSFKGWKPKKENIGHIAMAITNGLYSLAVSYINSLPELYGIDSIEECFQKAWDKISKRDGMMVNGFYVKYEDFTDEQKAEYNAAKRSHTSRQVSERKPSAIQVQCEANQTYRNI